MTETPKFTVVDRRKFRAEEDSPESTPSEPSIPAAVVVEGGPKPASPRLTLVEPAHAVAAALEPEAEEMGTFDEDEGLPPAPTAEESRFQQVQYEQAAERLDTLVRSQNPAMPATEKIGFEHLVQQLYLSAMMQMGAGTPEGQRPRIDILGARQTIDLLGVVLEKSKGNLSAHEERTLMTVLYELRMTFLELTRMIASQTQPPMPPHPGGVKR